MVSPAAPAIAGPGPWTIAQRARGVTKKPWMFQELDNISSDEPSPVKQVPMKVKEAKEKQSNALSWSQQRIVAKPHTPPKRNNQDWRHHKIKKVY